MTPKHFCLLSGGRQSFSDIIEKQKDSCHFCCICPNPFELLVLLLPISFSVDIEGSFSMLKAILIKQLACWVIGLISRLIPATEYKECSIKLVCGAQKMGQWIDSECMLLIKERCQIFLSKILLQPICQGTYFVLYHFWCYPVNVCNQREGLECGTLV